MKLPALDKYTKEELESASAEAPAVARYLEYLNKPAQDFSDRLRLKRHRAWLEAALATLLKKASAEDVCTYWSHAADQLMQMAWKECGLDSVPIALMAMGKQGALELNLSSDVDLVLISTEATDFSLKEIRQWIQVLSAQTHLGFCLRVDLDLRPGGKSGPLVSSITASEHYYWSQAEAWERLALVRLREVCGNKNAAKDFTQLAAKFVYRKYSDFTLHDELKKLRARIHHHYATNNPNEVHLKLAPGGIRDVELFIHSLQVIHGGKISNLRTASTAKAIEQIKLNKILPDADSDWLLSTYWNLREIENRVQAYDDQQTHTSPINPPLKKLMAKVDQYVSSLLGPIQGDDKKNLPETSEEQKDWLIKLGFNARSSDETWTKLLSATALSKKTERDESIRQDFLFLFVERLAQVGIDRDLGLSLLLDFVQSARAKATFFSLLVREKSLLDDLAVLFSTSPYLGGIIASRPELIDSILYQSQEIPDDFNAFLESSVERRLLTEIFVAKQFLKDHDVQALVAQVSKTADAICMQLLERLCQDHKASPLETLALGKWGGGELGLRSDLDFIILLPQTADENETKLARRFLNRLTEAQRGGSIYPVDMRLRPSGNSGPLLLTPNALIDYLENKAAAWERQTYLRARSAYPNSQNLVRKIVEICTQKGLSDEERSELKRIRQKLIQTPSLPEEIDLKYAPGGMIDLEFATQTSWLELKTPPPNSNTLQMMLGLEKLSKSWMAHGAEVRGHYNFFRQIEQIHQIVTAQSGSRLKPSSDSFLRLSQVLQRDKIQLAEELRQRLDASKQSLKFLDPIWK